MDLLTYIMDTNVLHTLVANIGPAKPDDISSGLGLRKATRIALVNIPVCSCEMQEKGCKGNLWIHVGFRTALRSGCEIRSC